jgi:hypothetical protein
MRPADTSPEAWKVFIELLRNLGPGEKMKQVLDYSWFLTRMGESMFRTQYPDASDDEIFMRMASRTLDADTIRRVYHWDPTTGCHVPQGDHQRS